MLHSQNGIRKCWLNVGIAIEHFYLNKDQSMRKIVVNVKQQRWRKKRITNINLSRFPNVQNPLAAIFVESNMVQIH